MIFCAEPQTATDSVQTSACPPRCSISALVCSAGLAEPPSPVTEAPISATITSAPAPAIMIAISRPMPPPAPVTTATLPSISPGTWDSLLWTPVEVVDGCDKPDHDTVLRGIIRESNTREPCPVVCAHVYQRHHPLIHLLLRPFQRRG